MTRNKLSLFVAVVALAAAVLACGFSASTARITEAFLSADPDGAEPTNVFFPDEVDFDTVIDEAELETGDGRLTFDLANDELWPAGNYKVDVYLNDNVVETLEFSVEG
jgi:outer membrane usher protein FimD/PapC